MIVAFKHSFFFSRPNKYIWHGATRRGEKADNCNAWRSNAPNRVGHASSLQSMLLLAQEKVSCENPLAVLCIEVNLPKRKKRSVAEGQLWNSTVGDLEGGDSLREDLENFVKRGDEGDEGSRLVRQRESRRTEEDEVKAKVSQKSDNGMKEKFVDGGIRDTSIAGDRVKFATTATAVKPVKDTNDQLRKKSGDDDTSITEHGEQSGINLQHKTKKGNKEKLSRQEQHNDEDEANQNSESKVHSENHQIKSTKGAGSSPPEQSQNNDGNSITTLYEDSLPLEQTQDLEEHSTRISEDGKQILALTDVADSYKVSNSGHHDPNYTLQEKLAIEREQRRQLVNRKLIVMMDLMDDKEGLVDNDEVH